MEDQSFHHFWGSETENCQAEGSQAVILRNIDSSRLILVNGLNNCTTENKGNDSIFNTIEHM